MEFQRWSILKNGWLKFNVYLVVSWEKTTVIFFLNTECFSGPFCHASSDKNIVNNSL